MVKTDFALSYLTGQIDDTILEELLTSKDVDEVDFTLSSPQDYWAKQQIKDTYKAPDGSYNKSKFDADFKNITDKFIRYDTVKFSDSLLDEDDEELPMYQSGDEILVPKKRKESANSMTREEYDRTSFSRGSLGVIDNSIDAIGMRTVNNQRYIKAGIKDVLVNDVYKDYSNIGVGYIGDNAKGKTVSQLAKENAGFLDEDNQLKDGTLFNKWTSLFEGNKVITIDDNGKFQEKYVKGGQDIALAVERGSDNQSNPIFHHISIGETLFGPQKYQGFAPSKTDNWLFDWDMTNTKAFQGTAFVAEALSKSAWNTVTGLGYGGFKAAKVLTEAVTNDEAPEWMNNLSNTLKSMELTTAQTTQESGPFGNLGGFGYAMGSGMGQLAVLAGGTLVVNKYLGKNKARTNKEIAKMVSTTIGGAFAVMTAADIDTHMKTMGYTDHRLIGGVYLTSVAALWKVDAALNIFAKMLPGNVKNSLFKGILEKSSADAVKATKGLADPLIVPVMSGLIKKNTESAYRAAMNQMSKVGKVAFFKGFATEGLQETSEAVIADASTLLIPRMWDSGVEYFGGNDEKYKFGVSSDKDAKKYREAEWSAFLDGTKFKSYLEEGAIGGITGGLASQIHGSDKEGYDQSYISALTEGGTNYDLNQIEENYKGILKELDALEKRGKLGSDKVGLNKNTFKPEVIDAHNRGAVNSFSTVIKGTVLNDLALTHDNLVTMLSPDGTLDQIKKKWEATDKTLVGVEEYQKYALNFAQKNIVQGYLMEEFLSIVTKNASNVSKISNLDLIIQRNELVTDGSAESLAKAQEIQNKIQDTKVVKEGKTAKEKIDVNDIGKRLLFDEKQQGKADDVKEKYSSLLNGNTFLKAMQIALLKTQIVGDVTIDGKNVSLVTPLDVFRKEKQKTFKKGDKKGTTGIKKSSLEQAVIWFNTLNTTSNTIYDLVNQQREAQRIKIDPDGDVQTSLYDLELSFKDFNDKAIQETLIKLKDDATKGVVVGDSTYIPLNEQVIDFSTLDALDKAVYEADDDPGAKVKAFKAKEDYLISLGLDKIKTDVLDSINSGTFSEEDLKGNAVTNKLYGIFFESNFEDDEGNSTFTQNSKILEDLRRKAKQLEDLKTLKSDTHPYFDRVDLDTFQSRTGKLKDIVEEEVKQEKEFQDSYQNPNLSKFLKEVNLRIAQVHLNYGANKRMNEYEGTVHTQMAGVYKSEAKDVKTAYEENINKLKAEEFEKKTAEEQGKMSPKDKQLNTLKKDGKETFKNIKEKAEYDAILKELKEMQATLMELKTKSDNNTPDINVSRMGEDLVHIRNKISLFNTIYVDPKLITIIQEIESIFDADDKVIEANISQDILDKYIVILNEFENRLHIDLSTASSEKTKVEDAFKDLLLKSDKDLMDEYGYTNREIEIYKENVTKHSVYAFYHDYASAKPKKDTPSFTQIEAIKDGYWNALHEPKETEDYGNIVLIHGIPGAGKSSIVGKTIAKMLIQERVSNEVIGKANNFSALEGYEYFGKDGKGSVVFKSETGDVKYITRSEYIGKDGKRKVKLSTPSTTVPIIRPTNDVLVVSKRGDRMQALKAEFNKDTPSFSSDVSNSDTPIPANITTDYINELIKVLKGAESSGYDEKNLIVIDEGTQVSGDQWKEIDKSLKLINLKRKVDNKPSLKILVLADLNQDGDISGIQGTFTHVSRDLIGTNLEASVIFKKENRKSGVNLRRGKELRVRFRNGNPSINNLIDFFRDGKYLEDKPLPSTIYYQGPKGLKGAKISDDFNYEISQLQELIDTNKVDAEQYIVIVNTEAQKQEVVSSFPRVKVFTVIEKQGGKADGVIFHPSVTELYGTFAKYTDADRQSGERVFSEGDKNKTDPYKVLSSIFSEDENGKQTGYSKESISYKLGFEIVSALGRATKYVCLIVPKNGPDEIMKNVRMTRSQQTENDVPSFTTDLTTANKKTNSENHTKLVKEEANKFKGELDTPEVETEITAPAPAETTVTTPDPTLTPNPILNTTQASNSPTLQEEFEVTSYESSKDPKKAQRSAESKNGGYSFNDKYLPGLNSITNPTFDYFIAVVDNYKQIDNILRVIYSENGKEEVKMFYKDKNGDWATHTGSFKILWDLQNKEIVTEVNTGDKMKVVRGQIISC